HPIQNLLEKGSSAPFGSQPHRALFFLRYSGYSSILMFGLAWYFILTGIKGKPHYYWLGSLYFILWLILNYFDTFGIVHGALPTAGFFTVVAILLFLAAYLSTKIKKEPDAEVSTENLPKSELASEPVSPLTTNSEPDKKERTANAPENQTVSSALYAGTVFTIFLQFACLFLFIITQTVMFWGGTRITVETQPVDPFDMFRGDYVRLSYPFSSVHSVPNNLDDSKSIVYVLLKRDPADNLWKPHTMSSQKPTANGGIVLRGRRSKRNGLITYGIETFFLQEGRGRQIEDAMARRSTRKKAVVDLLVAHNGRAQVENVRIIDVPETEALNENQPVETIQESPSDAESRTRDQPQ
ncbi:MAG: GDYXXLXY domain-containing protein, partial [Thermoguttaceae bacterium]|nr:GDYXXLXY domain-containing protein [Thermoguttaceae bacterium]